MTVLPGLTSTQKDAIPAFLRALRDLSVRYIALFPTVLRTDERAALYEELLRIPDLKIPHVHLRTDFEEQEMRFLVDRFATEVFNIHPRASRHPFGEVPPVFAPQVFVENSNVPVADEDLAGLGGICPDFSHLESARLRGDTAYFEPTDRQLARFPIGCCHVSAIRIGDPNTWSGGWDHHRMKGLSDLDYMSRYRDVLPERWVSLELENSLEEQVEAAGYLEHLLSRVDSVDASRS